jgi:hypothetical protein
MKNIRSKKYMIDTQNELHLEPRVARLESNLEALTKNIDGLTSNVNQLARTIEDKFSSLQIGLANANAPKATNWGLFISAVGLIFALGAAVLIPLNNATNDNKVRIDSYHQSMVEHQKLDMHPVGQARVDSLVKDLDSTKLDLLKRDSELDNKIQKETQLMTDLLSANISALDKRLQVEMGLKNDIVLSNQKDIINGIAAHEHADELERKIVETELKVVKEKNDLYIDKLFGRVQALENDRIKTYDKEHDELILWRQKAMGLSTPDAVVPLVKRDSVIIENPSKR